MQLEESHEIQTWRRNCLDFGSLRMINTGDIKLIVLLPFLVSFHICNERNVSFRDV